MFSEVLLTVDFDRTLTAPDSTIPERNLEAIRYFMQNGGAFTLNTGRSVNAAGALLHNLPVNAPFLLYNGSAAYDNGQLINVHRLQIDLWEAVEGIHKNFPFLNIEIQSFGPHLLYKVDKEFEILCDKQGWAHQQAVAGTPVEPLLKIALFGRVHDHTVGSFYNFEPWEMDEMNQVEAWLQEHYGDKVVLFRSAPRILDIHAKGISKGNAARQLQQQLGRKILVCVGDNDNDISMLDSADYAFVPGDSHLKNRYESVCNCGEGAVADVIYKKIPEILHIEP